MKYDVVQEMASAPNELKTASSESADVSIDLLLTRLGFLLNNSAANISIHVEYYDIQMHIEFQKLLFQMANRISSMVNDHTNIGYIIGSLSINDFLTYIFKKYTHKTCSFHDEPVSVENKIFANWDSAPTMRNAYTKSNQIDDLLQRFRYMANCKSLSSSVLVDHDCILLEHVAIVLERWNRILVKHNVGQDYFDKYAFKSHLSRFNSNI